MSAAKASGGRITEGHVNQILSGLAGDLTEKAGYEKAVAEGFKAVPVRKAARKPNDATKAAIAAAWVAHITPYAKKVGGRAASSISSAGQDVWDNPDDYADDIPDDVPTDVPTESGLSAVALAEIGLAAEAFRYSVTRYAEPLWGAGNNGYGAALDEQSVLVNWVIGDDNPCPDCEEAEANSPYDVMDLPGWPGDGWSQCRDNCKCSISADESSFDAAFS